jgi:hypothetical protein
MFRSFDHLQAEICNMEIISLTTNPLFFEHLYYNPHIFMCVPSSKPPWLKECDLLDCKNVSLVEVHWCFKRMYHVLALSECLYRQWVCSHWLWVFYIAYNRPGFLCNVRSLCSLPVFCSPLIPLKCQWLLLNYMALRPRTQYNHTCEKFKSSYLTELLSQ